MVDDDPFLKAFDESLSRSLLSGEKKIWIACSGGPDSVALTHTLLALRKKWKWKIGLLHFNHGLRAKASQADALFVKRLAHRLGLAYLEGKGDVLKLQGAEKLSLEEAARKARYQFFLEAAKKRKISVIVTAHTLEDQAETILMRVIQGTGLRGLCGIRPVLNRQGICFVRPFLGFSKQEILHYLKRNRYAFCKDLSNEDTRFLRNRIRRQLIPQLAREFNPQIVQALARIPESLGQEEEILKEAEALSWKKCLLSLKAGRLILRRKIFFELQPGLQFRVLDRALRSLDSRSGMDFFHWNRLRFLLRQPSCRYALPRDIELFLTPSRLMLCIKS